MGDWIRCTTAIHPGETVFVNLDTVDWFGPHERGTEIIFSGPDENKLVVSDTPGQIIAMQGQRSRA